MTTETFTPASPYTISGTGPYAIPFEYSDQLDIKAEVVDGDVVTLLTTSDYTIAPTTLAASGNLTLTSTAAATHSGKTLSITRATRIEQGWVGSQTSREKGLERQVDINTRHGQDIEKFLERVPRLPVTSSLVEPVLPVPLPGSLLIGYSNGWQNGPTVDSLQTVPLSQTRFTTVEEFFDYDDTFIIGSTIEILRGKCTYEIVASGEDFTHPASPSLIRVIPNENGEYPATAWGVADVATDQRAKIANMLSSGERAFYVPNTQNRIAMDGGVTVFAGQKIRGGRYDQKTLYTQTFDILKGQDGVRISDIDHIGTYGRAFVDYTWRGERVYPQSVAIWCGADDCVFENLKLSGGCSGIYLADWDHNTNTNVAGVLRNKVHQLYIDDMWCGLLLRGQSRAQMSHIYGTNIFKDPADINPPHMIYATGSVTADRHKQLSFTDLNYRGDPYDYDPSNPDRYQYSAVSVRYTDGCVINGLNVTDAAVFSTTSINDLVMRGVVGRRAVAGPNTVAAFYVYLAGGNDPAYISSRMDIEASIDMAVPSIEVPGRVATLVANDSKFTFRTSQTRDAINTWSLEDFHLFGKNNELNVFNRELGSVRNTDTITLREMPGMPTDNNTISFEGDGGTNSVFTHNPGDVVTGTTLKFNPDKVAVSSTGIITDWTAETPQVIRDRAEKLFTLAGGVQPVLLNTGSFYPVMRFRVTDASSYTVPVLNGNSTTSTPVGTEIEMIVENAFTGLISIGFSGSYKFADGNSTIITPEPGLATTFQFRYDGTNWIQINGNTQPRRRVRGFTSSSTSHTATMTIPEGFWDLHVRVSNGDSNHAQYGHYDVAYDEASVNDLNVAQQIGATITKGNVLSGLAVSVNAAGVITMTCASTSAIQVNFEMSAVQKTLTFA